MWKIEKERWTIWTMTVALVIGYALAFNSGVVAYLLETDKTFLTLIILTILMVITILSAVMVFTNQYDEDVLEQMEFFIRRFTVLGLIGTVMGILLSLIGGFASGEELAINFGFALTTTLAGAGAALFGDQLMLQLNRGKRNAEANGDQ